MNLVTVDGSVVVVTLILSPPGFSLLSTRPWELGSFHPGDWLAPPPGGVLGRQRNEKEAVRGECLLSLHHLGCGVSTLPVYELTFHRAPNSVYGLLFV